MTPDATKRILVVDDDPTIRRLVELCLDGSACHVDLRGGGDEALAAAGVFDFDMLILDLIMPGTDGWEVMRKLRATDSPVRILVTSAHGGADTRMRAELEGADGFLPKPFRPAELRRLVDNLG